MKIQLIYGLLFLVPSIAFSQNYQLEWQSAQGANIPNGLLNNNGYPPGSLDFDGDGINELVTIKQISGAPALVIINGADPQIRYRLLDENDQPVFPIQEHRFRGFFDIEADSNKTMVMFAKSSPNFVTLMNLTGDNGPDPFGTYSCDSLPPTVIPLAVKNMDGDPQFEIIVYNPSLQTVQIWGEGYTPGLKEPDDEYFQSPLMDCSELYFEWISPPNVSWPGDIDMLPPGRDDLNRDGNDDIVVISVDSFKVYSPFTQSFLSRIAIPANLQAAYGSDSPRFITFADMCGAPGKRHAIVGKPNNGNPNTPINKLNNFAVLQMTTAGGGLGWLRDTLFFVDDMILNSGGNPENWKLRAIADMDNDGEEEIVMQNVNSRRIALIGLGEEGGFTSGPINGIVGENQVADSPTGSYSLILKLESDPETEAFLVDRNLYRESEFDLNDNGTPDLLTWQEAEGDTSAFGCKVFDLEQNELIWSFDFPADQLQGGLRKFHGFHDVNADGQKEIFLGGFTVVTQDGTMHMPFSEDFRILTILDMDGDGFPDVLGVTPDDRIQVWGAGAISNVKETRFREGFSAMAFPNPARGVAPQLELSLVAGGAYTVTLHDLYGRQLRHKDLGQLSAGDHQISLSDWNSLNSGTYCLLVRGPSGERTLLIQFVE